MSSPSVGVAAIPREPAFRRPEAPDVSPAGRPDHTAVYDRAGHRLGRVETVVVDPLSGQPAYAIIGQGGLCGIGRKLRPAPWAALAYDARRDAYVASVDSRSFARAPRPESFTRCAEAGYRNAVTRYYSARERSRLS